MNGALNPSSCETSSSPFPRTLWTIVLEASSGDTPGAAEAMSKLCATYWEPILVWLQRRGYDRPTAEDLAQGFMEYLLEKNRLQDFVRGQAKFRSFMLECLKRYLRGEWRKAGASKRGGGLAPVPLDDFEPGVVDDSDKLLDRSFAVAMHRQVLGRMETQFQDAGKGERFGTLRRFILGDDPSVTYAEIAERLHLTTNAVKKAVFDLRDRYYEVFREQVAQTTNGESLEEEMRYLITLLAEADLAECA